MKVKFFLLTAMVLLFTGAAFAQSATCSGMSTGANKSRRAMRPLAVGLVTSSINPPLGRAHSSPTPSTAKAVTVDSAMPVLGKSDLHP